MINLQAFNHADVEPMNFEEEEEDRMEGPSRIVDKGKGRALPVVTINENTVYVEDLLAPGQLY